jgi:urease accessory protein
MEGIPPEVAKYASQKTTNETGKRGVLVLKLAGDVASGRTVVREQYSQVPLFAQKPMYLEDSLPYMAYMYIISPSGGVLQGDEYRMDISLADGAQAHLTTQGATRIYKMDEGFAAQQVDITVGSGCYLEYMPDQIIPYAGSRFYQKTNIKVHPDATAVYSEIISPGRAASSELFQYDVCYLRIHGSDLQENLKFADTAVLEPKTADVKALGMMEQDVIATVYVMAPVKLVPDLNKLVNAALADMKVRGGASILPHNCGISARMLGDYTGDLQKAASKIAEISRKLVLDAPFTKMRKE